MYLARILPPFISIFIFISILFTNINCLAASKHILMLNSYEADSPAVSACFKGLKTSLDNNKHINFVYSNESFHLLYFGQNPDYLQEMVRHIDVKYKKHPPDLIISDSYLLSFFADYLKNIFPYTPILCLEISSHKSLSYNAADNIIPILGFSNEHKKNIPLILSLFPKTKKIIVVVDNSYYGRLAAKDILNSNNKYKNNISFVFTNNMNHIEIMHEIIYSPSDTIIYYIGWDSYLQNDYRSAAQTFNYIRENTHLPIFTTDPYYIGRGAIGGYINHWDKLGKQTADISLDILYNPNHKKIYHINPINEYVFDRNELNHWNLGSTAIPINAKMKSEPISFWQQYKYWIIIGTTVIIIQTFLIAFLLFLYNKNKKSELKIKTLNNNLEQTVNERTAQLQATIDELTDIKYTQEFTNKYLIKLNKQLQTEAMTDELTGLYNRRYTLEKLKQLIKNFNDNNTIFSLAITDIDFFKKFNDTYGHDTGDFVLKSITQSMRFSLPNNFIVSRWGGEEFVILMPKTDITHAHNEIEKFRRLLTEKTWIYNLQKLHITMTFGLTSVHSNDNINEIIKRADTALYTGKEKGRNTVVIK